MVENDAEGYLIRPAVEKDFETIEQLCTLRFGSGYLKRGEFERWLRNPELFLVTEHNGDLVGYVCFLPVSPQEMAEYLHFPVEEVEKASGGKDVIHCKSTAVFSEYEHKGLMRLLWERILANVRNAGYRVAYGPAWKYRGFVPMDHLLTSLGFVPICEKEKLWFDDKSYTCIICGGPCKCPAVIYQLTM